MTPRTTRLLSWEGDLPECGHYLRTDAGTTYLVIRQRPARPGSKSVAVLDLLRLAPDEVADVPHDATVHGFAWRARR